MMKRMLVPLMFLFTMPVHAASDSDTPIIISYEQFAHLTRAEQKTYVKKLREMMIAIDQRNPRAAAELMRGSPWLRQIASITLPSAQAQQDKLDEFGMTKPDRKNFDEAADYLTEADDLREALDQTTQKATLTKEESAHLSSRLQGAVSWTGIAAARANEIKDEKRRKEMLENVKSVLAGLDKIEADAAKKNLVDANAKAQLAEARKSFVKPAIDGKVKPTDKSPFIKYALRPDERKVEEAKRTLATTVTGTQASGTQGTGTQGTEAKTAAPAAANGLPIPPPPPTALTVPEPKVVAVKPTTTAAGKPAVTAAGVRPPAASAPMKPDTNTFKSGKITAGIDGAKTPGAAKPANAGKTADPATTVGGAKTAETVTAVDAAKATEAAKTADANKAKDEEKTADGEKKLFRCMHSGFVIRGARCMAPTKLPFELEKIDEATFACADGTVMCNPFVFGVRSKDCDWKQPNEACWKNAKPICTTPALRSTEDCAKMSQTDSALESAVELIHANPKAFETFGADFKGLCEDSAIDYDSWRKKKRSAKGRAYVKADIEDTCKIAFAEAEKIAKRFGEKYGGKVSPETKAKLGQQPSTNAPATKAPAAGAKKGVK